MVGRRTTRIWKIWNLGRINGTNKVLKTINSKILIYMLNICNGKGGGRLYMALFMMIYGNVDIGILQKTKLIDGIYYLG